MSDSLREKTKDTRRRHVLDAAARVFAENGFRGATIRDVARAAGVADGTIYNAFENKAALLQALLDQLSGSAEAGLPASVMPAAFLDEFLKHRWASFTPEVLGLLRVVLSEALVDSDFRAEVRTRLIDPPIVGAEPILAAGMDEGSLAATDAALTSRVLTALVVGLAMLRLLGEPGVEARFDEIPAMLAYLLGDGLRPRAEQPSNENRSLR